MTVLHCGTCRFRFVQGDAAVCTYNPPTLHVSRGIEKSSVLDPSAPPKIVDTYNSHYPPVSATMVACGKHEPAAEG